MITAEKIERTTRDESGAIDKQPLVELATDFPRESRYEFVEGLAYKLWEKRGRPLGSPDVDWFAAEKAVYSSLVAAGMVTPSPNDLQNLKEKIYS